MKEHEWSALNLLSSLVKMEAADKTQEELYGDFLEQAKAMLGFDAMQKAITKELIELAFSLGGKETGHVTDLCFWSEKMVNSKVRRGTADLYKVVNALGREYPLCKVALIKHQYAQKSTEGIVPQPDGGWRAVPASFLAILESFLKY